MAEENISEEFRSKEIDKSRNYFIEEIKQNELSKKHKNVYKVLNYTEHLLNLASTVIGCVSISALASSLVAIPVDIASSAITIKISLKTAGI